jgi:hypothetical protein
MFRLDGNREHASASQDADDLRLAFPAQRAFYDLAVGRTSPIPEVHADHAPGVELF